MATLHAVLYALTGLFFILALPFAWTAPSAHDLLLMAEMGLAGGASQHFITRAYARAPAADGCDTLSEAAPASDPSCPRL